MTKSVRLIGFVAVALCACGGGTSRDGDAGAVTGDGATAGVKDGSAGGENDAAVSDGSIGKPPSGVFGVKVVGSTFASTMDDSTLQLIGGNISGLEGGPTSRWAGFSATTVAQWKQIAAPNATNAAGMNFVRFPLNSAFWLNTKGVDPGSASGGTLAGAGYHDNGDGTFSGDPTGTYRTVVKQAVANATAAGFYVSLDLHWDSVTAGGTTYLAIGQDSFPSGNAAAFWTSVADTFKDNPAVMFELFNEPFGGSYTPGAENPFGTLGADGLVMKNGGTFANFQMQDNQHNNTQFSVGGGVACTVTSKQALVNAIRATGATNVILDSPIWYAGSIEVWTQSKPTDSLGQLGCAWHVYGWNANGGNEAAGQKIIQSVITAGFPIMVTETYNLLPNFGGAAYLRTNHVGYAWWGWNNWGAAANLSQWIGQAPWQPSGTAPN